VGGSSSVRKVETSGRHWSGGAPRGPSSRAPTEGQDGEGRDPGDGPVEEPDREDTEEGEDEKDGGNPGRLEELEEVTRGRAFPRSPSPA